MIDAVGGELLPFERLVVFSPCCDLAHHADQVCSGDVESRSFRVLKSNGHYQRILNEKFSVLSLVTRQGFIMDAICS